MARRRKNSDERNELRKSNLPEEGEYYLIYEQTTEVYYAGGKEAGKVKFTRDADRASPYKTLKKAEETLNQLNAIPRIIDTDDGEAFECRELCIIDQYGDYVA